MARRLLTSWLAILGTSGCSFALDGPSVSRSRTEAPDCSDSKSTVVVDGFVAIATGIGAIVAADNGAGEEGALLGATSLLYTIAAVRGNGVVNRCRAAIDEFARAPYLEEQPPGRWRPPAERDAVAETPLPRPQPQPNVHEVPDPFATPHPVTPAPPAPIQPAVAPPPATPAAPIRPAPPAQPADDWSEFWEEVP